MAYADECPESMYLHGFNRILSKVRQGIFEDSKSDHRIVEEEQEVCLDREMRGSISEAQGVVENNTNTKGP
jgi:hypothetical protein